MRPRVLTVGSALCDIFLQYETPDALSFCFGEKKHAFILLQEGKKVELSGLDFHVGGGATNSATCFARLGLKTAIFSKIGTDAMADIIVTELKKEQINLDYLLQNKGAITGTSFIVPCPSGNRTVLVFRGKENELNLSDITDSLFFDTDFVYITSLPKTATKLFLPLVTLAKKFQKKVIVNPGSTQLHTHVESMLEALPFIDILILNRHEAQLLLFGLYKKEIPHNTTKENQSKKPLLFLETVNKAQNLSCFDVRTFFKEIFNRGPQLVVVTNGSDGVYAATPHQIFYHPSPSIPVISTVGAGDAFGATFTAHIIEGATIETAIRSGIVNSGSVIQHLGAHTGLLSQTTLQRQISTMNESLLQIFSWK